MLVPERLPVTGALAPEGRRVELRDGPLSSTNGVRNER
jgi:hypothetical protein